MRFQAKAPLGQSPWRWRWGWSRCGVEATIYQAIAGKVADATGYSADPAMAGVDQLPAGIIGRPSGRRLPPRIGTKPYVYEIPVTFYSDLSAASRAHDEQAETIEAFIRAVDADHTLSGLVEEAVVSSWSEPEANRNVTRPLLYTEATVSVLTTI